MLPNSKIRSRQGEAVLSNLPKALRFVRQTRGMPQEAFDLVSSRIFISPLERGLKVPTLSKVEQLAEQLRVRPLTLLALINADEQTPASLERLAWKIPGDAANLNQ